MEYRPGSKPLFRAIRILATIFLLLVVLRSANGQPLHLYLRNGDRVTATILAEDNSRVVVSNALIGRFIIPLGEIQRREPVVIQAATEPAAKPRGSGTNTVAATPPLTPEMRKRLDDLAQIYMANQISASEFQRRRADLLSQPKTPVPSHWSGEILSGVDLGYGAKSRQNFSGRFKLNYADKRIHNAFDYLFTYGHTDGALSANRMDMTDKLDINLTPRYYVYGLGGAGYDEIRRIDYYLQAGPGVGEHVIKRTNFVLNVEGGFSYQLQNFEEGKDSFLFYYRLAEDSKWSITPKFIVDQKLEYTPQWDNFGQYKVRGELNLSYWILHNLSLNLTVIDLYDTRVAQGIDRNDLQIRSSIGVKF